MKALLKKEFYTGRKLLRAYVFTLALFIVIGIYTKNPSFMSMMFVVIVLNQTITGMTYDEYSDWNSYALSMPISRREIVISKYLSYYIGIGFFTLIFTLISLLSLRLIDSINPADLYLSFYSSFSIINLIFLTLMPIILKFGTEKARLAIFGVMGLIGLASYILFKFIEPRGGFTYLESKGREVLIASLIGHIVLLIGSLLLSVKIFNKKDL